MVGLKIRNLVFPENNVVGTKGSVDLALEVFPPGGDLSKKHLRRQPNLGPGNWRRGPLAGICAYICIARGPRHVATIERFGSWTETGCWKAEREGGL